MTKSELKPLYVEACTRARATPQRSEEAVWFSCIGFSDIRDLKEAIDAHFAKSQWMPKEGELKPLIEQARRNRSRDVGRTTYGRWQCPDCRLVMGDFIEPSDYRPRRCYRKVDAGQICGALMTQMFRGDNFQSGNGRTA